MYKKENHLQTKSHLELNAELLEEGLTPLQAAIYKRQKDVVAHLLSTLSVSDINAVDASTGKTALHFAAANGDLELIKVLIQKGANPLAKTKRGEMPVDTAAKHQDWKMMEDYFFTLPEVVEEYVSSNIDFYHNNGYTRFHWTVENGRLDLVKKFVEKKIDVNIFTSFTHVRKNALHIAASEGHVGIVRYLLTHSDIKIDAQDAWGNTALQLASSKNHRHIVKLLENPPSKRVLPVAVKVTLEQEHAVVMHTEHAEIDDEASSLSTSDAADALDVVQVAVESIFSVASGPTLLHQFAAPQPPVEVAPVQAEQPPVEEVQTPQVEHPVEGAQVQQGWKLQCRIL